MSSIEPERAQLDAPRYARFGGVLEGGVDDAGALRAAAARIPAAPNDLIIEGGRFTLHFDDVVVPGERVDVAAQDALLDALSDVVRAADGGRALESTLRATLVHHDRVVETLFTIETSGGERTLAPITRERRTTPADLAEGASDGDGGLDAPFRGLGRGRGLALLALIVAGAALAAWRAGYVDMARSALDSTAAEDLAAEPGPFGDALVVTVERTMLRWECEVSRGPAYPTTPEALDARIARATTNAERAAARVAGEGGAAWLRGLDADGEVVASARIELGDLVGDADATVSASLGPRHRIVSVALALGSGMDGGERER